MGNDPIRRLWWKFNESVIDTMATDISDEVQRMAVTSLPVYRYVTLRGTDIPHLSNSEDGEKADAIPDSYIVETDEKSLSEVFDRTGSPKGGGSWTWGEVKPSGEQHAWISELATAMALYIRDEKIPTRIRSSFKAAKDYTPVLDQINRSSDDYSFHVLFLDQTWNDRKTEPVSSLGDLMVRLGELIMSTTAGDTIRYLAYTPALGFLAETEDQWKSLRKSMASKAAQIDMICLNEAELERWHGEFLV
ncbi:MAG: hypothetical protein ACREYE_29740 [Gammaproteobacteria bacterium]